MDKRLKRLLKNTKIGRTSVLTVLFCVLSFILINRLYNLQIIDGARYRENFSLQTTKTRTLKASRGIIYDRNGIVLASNELSYSLTIEDSGTYPSYREKALSLNGEAYRIGRILTSHGDSLDNFKTEMLMMAFGEIWHSHLHIENPTHLDLTALMRKARLYKRLKELDVLIVDYLHLLDVRFSTNWDETRKMATWTLKNLAKELNIPILLLCPLRRKESNEDWKDLLSDLTEISGITQEADFVWIVDQAYRRTQHEEDREKADVTIVKIPDKTAKRIPLRFTNERGFTSVEL